VLPDKGGKCPSDKDAMASFLPSCLPPSICQGGTCGDPLAKGATCDPMKPACAKGLECDKTAKTCADLPGAGKPCQFECAAGFNCVQDEKGQGTCKAEVCGG
jgi:hypothetical protein